MNKLLSLFFSAFLSFAIISEAYTDRNVDSVCQQEEVSLKNESLSINVEKTSSGEWVVSFVANKHLQPTTSTIKLNVMHSVVQCGNEKILQIKGSITDNIIENYTTVLKTKEYIISDVINQKPSCCNGISRSITLNRTNKGRNVLIDANGCTAHRESPLTDSRDFAGTVTSMPLEEEELFEVRFDSIVDREDVKGHATAFGVIVTPPENIMGTRWIHHGRGTWTINGDWIWIDGKPLKSGYRLDTVNLPAGTRLGAMVKKNGDLHFFKNGEDMGIAASNVPKRVYGFLELNNYLSRASIVS